MPGVRADIPCAVDSQNLRKARGCQQEALTCAVLRHFGGCLAGIVGRSKDAAVAGHDGTAVLA